MKFLLFVSSLIDKINDKLAKVFYWGILLMCLISAFQAITRHVFNFSPMWNTESQWYIFSAVFLLCAPATLLHNGHVRIDVFYNRFSRKKQIYIDIFGTLVFLLPICAIIFYDSLFFVYNSYSIWETSQNPGGLLRWPVKALLPIGFFFLILQGFSEFIKRIGFLLEKLPDPLNDVGLHAEENLMIEAIQHKQ